MNENIDKSLNGGTFEIGPIEVTMGKFNPSKIGGFDLNEGDVFQKNVYNYIHNEPN